MNAYFGIVKRTELLPFLYTAVQSKSEQLTYPQCKHAGDPIKLSFAK